MTDTRTVRTMCPMNCHPTLCGMLADVLGGELAGVRGDPENPDSRGFLCVRGKASREVIGNPERLLYPMVRERRGEDDWRRASWDEALDRIAAHVEAVGREAVGFWPGHGIFTTNYGSRINGHLLARFANLSGCQTWNPAMICWGLGGFGLGLTGVLETNTKEDMGAHSELIVFWGANLASQPNTAPHLVAARKRGARVVTIDVRRTEAAAQSDEVLLIRPGTDAALALGMMHVIVSEGLHDTAFVDGHTVGFEQLAGHLSEHTPQWAAEVTGIPAERIEALARAYAGTRPAMIVLGGSSMHKSANAWHAARAVVCLPALTGNLGIPGGGLGPRHGSAAHGRATADITAADRRVPGLRMPNQMTGITEALLDGRVRAMLLCGTNMLSSFAEAERVAEGLARAELVVSYDLFLNETSRRFADVVLPGTAWLEEVGCKMTHTHVYLMDKALEPPGETRNLYWLLGALAERLGVKEFTAWPSDEAIIDAVLDHPATGHATVASLRAAGGFAPLDISPVAYPDHAYDTPSGKVEFVSERAGTLGLPALPVQPELPPAAEPLLLTQGRTMSHFHGFYDQGRALPTLANQDPHPVLWMAPGDAAARNIGDGAAVRIHNGRGGMTARAKVTEQVPTGVVWMRDGWPGLNTLSEGAPVLPDSAVDLFPFSAGQATFDTQVDVETAE